MKSTKKMASAKSASLATKVKVSALFATVLIMGVLVSFDALRLSSVVSTSLERRAAQVAGLQSNALLQPISDYEMDIVEEMLSRLTADPEMQAARILGADGEILVESGSWMEHSSTILPIEQRLDLDGEHLGDFQLQVSRISLIEARNAGIYTGIVSLLITALAIWFVLRFSFQKITRPLESMIETMTRLTNGDTSIAVPAQDRNDEIGRIAAALEIFRKNAIEREKLEEAAKQSQLRSEEEKRLLMSKMAEDFEASVGDVVERVSAEANRVRASAKEMADTVETMSQQSASVVTASSQASANVQTVAGATDEISNSIAEISRQSAQSTSIADRAVREMENTNRRVQSLSESANKIGQVIGLINDVAEQTNLLALNATIEAARAGDAGKGFAVVASEVKNLATQTSVATDEISGQISEIQAAVKDTVSAMAEVSQIISETDNIASSIAAAVEEQSAATREVSQNIDEASSGTQKVTSNITGINQAVSQTGTEADLILKGAVDMTAQSDVLKREVSAFLANIKTG